jgi:hypothetical protein
MSGQVLPVRVEVVLVAVVHRDPGAAGQDPEPAERRQVAPAEVEQAVLVGDRRQNVAFLAGRYYSGTSS